MPGSAGVGDPERTPIDLVRAYLATDYVVDVTDGELTLRIGEQAAVPAPRAGRVHAVLSAGNPQSRALSPAQNARADDALRARLDALGLVWRSARGIGRDGAWPPEASAWIEDIAIGQLDALALAFDQNAGVVVSEDRRTRLRLFRPAWRAALPAHADLDWP